MRSAIVTVKTGYGQFWVDMELPLDVSARELAKAIMATLGLYERSELRAQQVCKLRVEHLGRVLDDDETLEEAGVWDGSIIVLE